ncbi:MAG TPA: nucleotidyltransferase family protein, partial [Fimbriimonadaceae bacterium]|nr:nucleotidyltransferase family protein [Fimbriimonadaceae bacterium]
MTVGVILAAGLSTRFGSDKLSAKWGETTLLEHVRDRLGGVDLDELAVVLGPLSIGLEGVTTILNNSPESGLGHSVSLAARWADGVDADLMLLVLADMPGVSVEHLEALLDALDEHEAAGSLYPDGRIGVPAAFSSNLFDSLYSLSGLNGAQRLLHEVAVGIHLPEGEAFDVDT